jgi:hypothetical protein
MSITDNHKTIWHHQFRQDALAADVLAEKVGEEIDIPYQGPVS